MAFSTRSTKVVKYELGSTFTLMPRSELGFTSTSTSPELARRHRQTAASSFPPHCEDLASEMESAFRSPCVADLVVAAERRPRENPGSGFGDRPLAWGE